MRASIGLGVWIAASSLILAAAAPARAQSAQAVLADKTGKTVGEAQLDQTPHGVVIHLDATGLPPGTHAFHVHAVGKCEPPDFSSAGGHFNPAGHQHGVQNPAGMHAGDLPNLEVPADGKLRVDVFAPALSLSGGHGNLFDADGSALVIHEKADDYKSDPAGNAGARIACGVVTKR